MNVAQVLDSKTVDSEQKSIVMTCPVCEHKISFKISEEELKKAKIELQIIKKAINHNNHHVIVVHIDSQGNVRRTYGYQCAEVNSKSNNAQNDFVTTSINDSVTEFPIPSDHNPGTFLKDLLVNMEKSSKNK